MSDKYTMTISLNVLNHLGINLYSNVPAVICEAVANAWDADATHVEIAVDKENDIIIVSDNGCGMDLEDINKRYLLVGYQRRKEVGKAKTPSGRGVMGRKGIGKLSLFSVVDIIDIYTMKNGEINNFRMSGPEIKKLLEGKNDSSREEGKQYHPKEIQKPEYQRDKQGTTLVLRHPKKRLNRTALALRKRLARRFSVLEQQFKFDVTIDRKKVTINDRDYFHKIQYIWAFGDRATEYIRLANKNAHSDTRDNKVTVIQDDGSKEEFEISGWIGTVEAAGLLKDGEDNLNKILIMVRGKLAQEDILEDFPEGGLYTKYLIGEINADFLDIDDRDDIATSNRQEIIKDDPRYLALQKWIQDQLDHIRGNWTELRNEAGTDRACEIEAVKEWYETLKGDRKKKAKALFGKINQLKFDDERDRRQILKFTILAFESLSYQEALDRLDSISVDNISALGVVFSDMDALEATYYHEVVKSRLEVIKKLETAATDHALEKVIQAHLHAHLWLLDPSWDRTTENDYMERTAAAEFGKIDAKLTDEERRGRLDIKYKLSAGKHIIIELKRASVVVDSNLLERQVIKYTKALRKLLSEAKKEEEPEPDIEAICVLGKKPSDWKDDPDRDRNRRSAMRTEHIRVVYYRQLLKDAYATYGAFLESQKEVGRILDLIRRIDEIPKEELAEGSKDFAGKQVEAEFVST